MSRSIQTTFATLLSVCLTLAATAQHGQAQAAGASQKVVVAVPGARPSATLSAGVRVGNLLFVSGQLGTGTDTTIEGQTKLALENTKKVLDAAGAKVEDVVKCTVFLKNVADFGGMNTAYSAFFSKDPPARSTVAVAALVSSAAKVEIECIAAMPK
jgi:2-iminobutanoate/2-iminopropanoate deaminase